MTGTKFKIIVSSGDGEKRMGSIRRNKGCNIFVMISFFF